VFKKALQIVVTLGVLLGGYQAYLLGFAVLTERIGDRRGGRGPAPFVIRESQTSREATRLAGETWGRDHWAASKDVKIRFQDKERGSFLYASNYKRLDNGKKFEFWPFAVISVSKDGKSRKTALSERAIIELNEPMALLKPGAEEMHVVQATLEDGVILRDDKGTRDDPRDDLVVGPLPYIEYSEKTDPPEIRSKSPIRLVDRDLVVTGTDLLIQLRRRDGGGGGAAGFDARTAFLKQEVRIVVGDVGQAGVLPGTAKGTAQGAPTPLVLKSDGEMRIDFPPRPRPLQPWAVGPPEMEGPTIATFHRNVEVVRGRVAPDVLNCDTLRLGFLPIDKASRTDAQGAAPEADGPLTDLALNEANAKGFAVWLRSTAQETTAKCNELIYKKRMPFAPDETYLRADATRQLFVEKLDHEEATADAPGAVTSVTTIYAADAKIFDDGKGGAASTVIARGPGRLETRPARDKSADQTAAWSDELVMITTPAPRAPATVVRGPEKAAVAVAVKGKDKPEPAPAGRQVTLVGDPKLTDHAKEMTLTARRSIVASLKPRPAPKDGEKAGPAGPKATASGGLIGGGSSRIEWLQARDDVHLTAPGKTMDALTELNVRFEDGTIVTSGGTTAPTKPAAPAAEGAKPEATAVASTRVAAPESEPGRPAAKAADEAPRAAPEPAVQIKANRVWAWVVQTPGTKPELSRAMLRGGVSFHQDGTAEQPRGTEGGGEALDLESVGNGLMNVKLYDTDPSALGGRTRLAATGERRPPTPAAWLDTEDYQVRGPAIGLNQSRDMFWVDGKGSLTQLAERGFLSDRGVQERIRAQGRLAPKDREAEKGKKQPLTIAWSREMRFYGRAKDPQGRPAGKAEFRGDVDARMEDARINADEMDTYTDRPVALVPPARPKARDDKGRKSASSETALIDAVLPAAARSDLPPATNAEDVPEGDDAPRPELAYFEARNAKVPPSNRVPGVPKDVLILAVKRDPASGEWIERQWIEGTRVLYDKRTGDFQVPGRGLVRIWRRSPLDPVDPSSRPASPAGPLPMARGTARPIARGPRDGMADGGKAAKRFGPWELTKIEFHEEMSGRFGVGRDRDEAEPRLADFWGDVKAIHGKVASENSDLSWDSEARSDDVTRLTSHALRTVDIPPPPGVKDRPARQLVTAGGPRGALAYNGTRSVNGNWLTYDSLKKLFYAYGEDGQLAKVTDQRQAGQPPTIVRGTTIRYNLETGASEVDDPIAMHLVDFASTARSQAEKPAGPEKPDPRNRHPDLRPPGTSHIERRGFTGR